MDLKSISIPSFFYSLLWGFQVTVDAEHGMERLNLRTMYCYLGPCYHTVSCNREETSYHSFQQHNVLQYKKGNELFNAAY